MMRDKDKGTICEAVAWYFDEPKTYSLGVAGQAEHIWRGTNLMFSLLKLLSFHWPEANALLKPIRKRLKDEMKT